MDLSEIGQDRNAPIKTLGTVARERHQSTMRRRSLYRVWYWAIALNFCTPGVEEQWNSSGVSYKSCGILQGLSQKSWNSLGVKQ